MYKHYFTRITLTLFLVGISAFPTTLLASGFFQNHGVSVSNQASKISVLSVPNIEMWRLAYTSLSSSQNLNAAIEIGVGYSPKVLSDKIILVSDGYRGAAFDNFDVYSLDVQVAGFLYPPVTPDVINLYFGIGTGFNIYNNSVVNSGLTGLTFAARIGTRYSLWTGTSFDASVGYRYDIISNAYVDGSSFKVEKSGFDSDVKLGLYQQF